MPITHHLVERCPCSRVRCVGAAPATQARPNPIRHPCNTQALCIAVRLAAAWWETVPRGPTTTPCIALLQSAEPGHQSNRVRGWHVVEGPPAAAGHRPSVSVEAQHTGAAWVLKEAVASFCNCCRLEPDGRGSGGPAARAGECPCALQQRHRCQRAQQPALHGGSSVRACTRACACVRMVGLLTPTDTIGLRRAGRRLPVHASAAPRPVGRAWGCAGQCRAPPATTARRMGAACASFAGAAAMSAIFACLRTRFNTPLLPPSPPRQVRLGTFGYPDVNECINVLAK